jgi:hypothetical protein
MQVTFPTALVGDRFLIAEGCRAHDCGNHAGLVIVDLQTGIVVAFRRGQYGFLADDDAALEAFVAGWREQAP